MLVSPQQNGPLQQGDVICDVPFVVLGTTLNVQASETKGQSRLNAADPTSFDRVKEYAKNKKLNAVNVPLVLQPGIVITQGCDISHKDNITMARVFPIQQLVAAAKDAIELNESLALHDMIRGLTEGYEYANLVYLGHLEGLGRCVADLMRVQSYHEVWKNCFLQKRWKSLNEEGLKYLQGRLSLFTGRFALEDGFWHTDEDAEVNKRAQAPDALQESLKRLKEKQIEAKRKTSA